MTSDAKLQGEADLRVSAVALRKTAVGRSEHLSTQHLDADVDSACIVVDDGFRCN